MLLRLQDEDGLVFVRWVVVVVVARALGLTLRFCHLKHLTEQVRTF